MIFFKKNDQPCGIAFLDNASFSENGGNAPIVSFSENIEDIQYVYPDFRALSQGVARKRGENSTISLDFREKGVLQKATPLYLGVGVYPNHLHDIERWKGIITHAAWCDDRSDGLPIPGVNVTTKIWKGVDQLGNVICPQDYKTARGILDEIITRVSTGLYYTYRQSHKNLSPYEFFSLMGTEVDGREVCMVITSIITILELSLVIYGADEYAHRLSAAMAQFGIKQKDITASFSNDHLDIYAHKRRFWSNNTSTLLKTLSTTIPEPHPPATAHDMQSLDIALDNVSKENARLHEELDILQQQLAAALLDHDEKQDTSIISLKEENTSLTQENTRLRKDLTAARAELIHTEYLAEYGRTYMQDVRDNAVRAYRLLCESSIHAPSESEQAETIQLLSTMPIDMAEKMLTTFTSKALTVIPVKRVSRALNAEKQPQFYAASSGYRRQLSRQLSSKDSPIQL